MPPAMTGFMGPVVLEDFSDLASARRVIREYLSLVISSKSFFASLSTTTKNSSFLLETCSSAPGYSSLSFAQPDGMASADFPSAEAMTFGAGRATTRGELGARAQPGKTATVTAK